MQSPSTRPSVAAPDARPRLALVGSEATGDVDPRDTWIPTAIEETLAWRLRRVPGLIVVPTVRLHQARRELQDQAEPPPWPRVAACLGAQRLLTGRCQGNPDAVSLQLSLTGLGPNPVAPAEATLPPARLFEAVDAATRWALEKLNVERLPNPVERLIFSAPARSPSALEYYARAVAAARTEQFTEAGYYALQAVDYDNRYRPTLALIAQLELQRGSAGLAVAGARLRAVSDLAQLNADPLDWAAAELGLGVLLQLSGAFDAAYTRFETSLGMSYEQDSPYGQIAAVNGLCDLYLTRPVPPGAEPTPEQFQRFELQNLRRAAEWQEVGMGLLEQLGDAVGEAPAANKLALTYEKLGERAQALTMHQRSLAAAERAASRRNQATAWLYIAQWYQHEQRWSEALEAARRCEELASDPMKPVAWLTLGGIYEGQNAHEDALDQFERAYARIREGRDLTSQLLCARHIAELRMQLGRRDAALAALQEAIDVAHALGRTEETALREKLTQWKNRAP